MKPTLYSALLAALLALAGCQGGDKVGGTSDTVASTNSTGAANGTNTAAASSTTGGATTGTATTGGGTPAVKPPEPQIAADLKTDAYHWYGLGNTAPMKVEVKVNGGTSYTGTQTVHFQAMKNGRAIFEIARDGELGSQLGTDTLSLEKDGLYTVKSTRFVGTTRNLELPSKLPVGATWRDSGKLTMTGGEKFDQNVSFKVVGPQDVTTPVGKQSALLVTSTGNVKTGQGDFKMVSSIWYVKDKGIVKSVVTLTNLKKPKEKPQEITIEETN